MMHCVFPLESSVEYVLFYSVKYVISQITLATLLARSYLWLNGNKIICLKWLDLCKETENLLNVQKLHQSILLGSLDLSSHEVSDTLTWAPPPLQYRSVTTAHCNCSASIRKNAEVLGDSSVGKALGLHVGGPDLQNPQEARWGSVSVSLVVLWLRGLQKLKTWAS